MHVVSYQLRFECTDGSTEKASHLLGRLLSIENISGWYCMELIWCSVQLFELVIGVGMHLARHCFFVKSLYLHLFLGNKSFGSFYIVNDMWQWQSTFYLWTFIIYFCCSWTHFFLCCYVLVRKVTSKRVTRMQCIPSIL